MEQQAGLSNLQGLGAQSKDQAQEALKQGKAGATGRALGNQ
jgi:hypothetical protein